jgi:general secretion pathway protein A
MYQEHFKLRTLPFVDASDPQTFYLNHVYEAGLTTLRYGVLAKKGVMVLTGATGTGKSALLRKLFHDLADSVKPIWITGNGTLLAGILNKIVAELTLELQSRTRPVTLEGLESLLLESAERERFICVVIDEAENFDATTLEGLRQLSNFEADGQKLLQLVLVGRPEFLRRLDDPELRSLKQRVALHVRLLPLDTGEVRDYIESRLRAAGYGGADLFTPGAVARIAEYSGGIPRVVNTICDNALLIAYCNSEAQVSEALVEEVATNIGLAGHHQGIAGETSSDGQSWPEWRNLQADAQFETVWSNLEREDESLDSEASAGPRRRTLLKSIGAAVVLLIAATAVGAIMRIEKVGSIIAGETDRTVRLASDVSNQLAMGPKVTISDAPQELNGNNIWLASDAGELPAAVVTETDTGLRSSASRVSETDRSAPAPRKSRATQKPTPATTVTAEIQDKNAALKRKSIENDIQRAIQHRAIEGVTVRLIDGTAILGGRVASVRQRMLAERAAKSVTQVARVENQIAIQP